MRGARSLAMLTSVALLAANSMTACGGGGAGGGTPSGQIANVRFINGSPDIGLIDVAIGSAGNKVSTSVPYGEITPYTGYNPGLWNVYVYQANTTNLVPAQGTPPRGPSTVIQLIGTSRTTVVLAGRIGNSTLQTITFNENLFATASNQAAVNYHHAAPNVNAALTFGYYPWPGKSSLFPLDTLAPNRESGTTRTLPTVIASSGIGFYGTNGASAPFTIIPSQVDPSDTLNIMPQGSGNTWQNLSLYAVDGTPAGAASFLGVFDPNH